MIVLSVRVVEWGSVFSAPAASIISMVGFGWNVRGDSVSVGCVWLHYHLEGIGKFLIPGQGSSL